MLEGGLGVVVGVVGVGVGVVVEWGLVGEVG